MNVTFAAPGQPKTGVLVIFCPENKKLLGVAADRAEVASISVLLNSDVETCGGRAPGLPALRHA